jgi:hypothetical protein
MPTSGDVDITSYVDPFVEQMIREIPTQGQKIIYRKNAMIGTLSR